MIDGTILRDNYCAGGASQNDLFEPKDQALGRSKGGFSTKIHVIFDAIGIPLDLVSLQADRQPM